ncbi:hypothetical protein [Humibacter antri]
MATRVDALLIDQLEQQTDQLRKRDRTFGGKLTMEHLAAHITELQNLTAYSLTPSLRERLAAVLADAATLAGWQAVDVGRPMAAWAQFLTAENAARLANSPLLLAHALGEHAYAVMEAGDPAAARYLIAQALHTPALPPLLQAWLHAADGEFASVMANRDQTLASFEKAASLLPADFGDETMPFITLNSDHLERWRGNALARLGDPEAVAVITAALERINTDEFVRATATMHTDLAFAYAAQGEREQALQHVRHAEDLALQLGSERLRARLAQVRTRLPPG